MTALNRDAAARAVAAGLRARPTSPASGCSATCTRWRARAGRPRWSTRPRCRTSTARATALADGFVRGGSRRNLDWVRPHLDARVDEDELLLLADAQTSGGLLVAGELPGHPVIGEVVRPARTRSSSAETTLLRLWTRRTPSGVISGRTRGGTAWRRQGVPRVARAPPADRRRPPRPRPGRRARAAPTSSSRAPRPPTGSSRASAPTAPSAAGSGSTSRTSKVVQIEGDPDSPDLARPAVPQGLGQRAAGQQPAARRRTVPTAARTAPSGRTSTSTTAMDMIADRVVEAARATLAGRRRAGPAAAPHHGHRQRSAGRRSTTRRTTSSRSCSPRWARSRSRTRRAFDTPPRSPVWGPRSGAAAPPASSRTWPTRTASSSRARTWPRPPGRLPVGDGGQGARRQGDPRRPALHPHVARSPTSTSRSAPAATSRSSAASSTTS